MDKKRSVDIYREPNAVPLSDYLENYGHNWTPTSYEYIQNSNTTKNASIILFRKKKKKNLQ